MITLSFIGPITRPPSERVERALGQARTVQELLLLLGFPREQLRFIRVSTGQGLLRLTDALPEAGDLCLSVPMGGG